VPSNRGTQRSNQKTVIAARQIAADGSRRIATEAVRHQPFPLFGDFKRAANLAAEFDMGIA